MTLGHHVSWFLSTRAFWGSCVKYVLVLLLAAALPAAALGQQGVVGRNFRVIPEYYPAPHQTQMKSLLEGGSAQADPSNPKVYVIRDVRLRTFNESGQAEMEIQAPDCRYHQDEHTISSPGSLLVRTADGRFSVEGRGFLWRESSSSLTISNDVATVIEPAMLQKSETGGSSVGHEGGPIRIASDSFNYSREAGRGVYQGSVRVTGTNLFLSSGELVAEVPIGERQFRSIAARQAVQMEYGGIHASGEEALYRQDTGILQVTGSPEWETEFRRGKADSITIDRTNRLFRAEGNAFLLLSGPELGRVGLGAALPGTGVATPATNRQVAISSANYVILSNSARFEGGVRVVDQGEGSGEPVKLDCQTLSLAFAGTNELQRILAQGNVIIVRGDQQFAGKEAVYNAGSQLLSIAGEPRWRAADRHGYGQIIEVDTGRGEMLVRGNACLELPAGELAGTSGQSATSPATSLLSTNNSPATICAEEYSVTREVAVFLGAVEIRHPQMRWRCDRLAIGLPAAGGVVDRILAEPDVRFDFIDSQGRSLYGRGDQAIYTRRVTSTATNSWLELHGAPASLQTTNGMTVRNRVLRFDLLRSKFVVPPGSYKILGPTNSTASTNFFQLPAPDTFSR